MLDERKSFRVLGMFFLVHFLVCVYADYFSQYILILTSQIRKLLRQKIYWQVL